MEIAEARKFAGNVSAESEVTPLRSFSLNIFLQDGERVNVFVPSCHRERRREDLSAHSTFSKKQVVAYGRLFYVTDLIWSSLSSHRDKRVVFLFKELSCLKEGKRRDNVEPRMNLTYFGVFSNPQFVKT